MNTERIDHIYQDINIKNKNFILHYGDLTDSLSLQRIIKNIKPNEIYNLAAQSHVAVSFEEPEYTANADALGCLRLLEIIKNLNLNKRTKFYQAGTSELYGNVQSIPQNEKTPFYPLSPYGVAKLYAHWITKNYREAYNIFACNGILFNHESKRRGETFVTRKISRSLTRISQGLDECLYLGNLNALRDWGHAKDYVRMQWMMLQQDHPKDFVIASGEQITVRDFVNIAANSLGISLTWKGNGLNEIGIVKSVNNKISPNLNIGEVIVKVDANYFRPTEVETLLGDPSRASKKLGWQPEIKLEEMINEMVEHDLTEAKKEKYLKNIK